MKWIVGLAMLVLAANAQADDYKWRRVAEVDEVAITVAVVSLAELRALQLKHGDRTMYRGYTGKGLALLFRDTTTGAYRCEVYLRDAGDTETIEHETRHCYGWTH